MRRELAGLAGLLAAEVAGLVVLLRLGGPSGMAIGWADLRGWVAAAAPADAVVAVLRVAGLGCGGWLLLTTLACTATRLAGSRRGWPVLERLTLPLVRRLADRAVAVVLATSGVAGGAAGAAEPVPVLVPPGAQTAAVERADGAVPVLVPPGAQVVVPQELAAGASGDAPAGVSEPSPGARAPGTTARVPREVDVRVVAEGDHLWGIARALLVAARGTGAPAPSGREVHARWLTLLEANAGRLSSGDPDRIFAGEELLVARESEPPAHTGTADPDGA